MAVSKMGFSKTINYALPKEWKCMNCSKAIPKSDSIYSRRFCSKECMLEYLL